ncbi:MAG TPA: T9SS type A sorting domain-containing protein [Chitinophagaceae bacterium]|nr:T9SS type A sorting domain-containing protein [Chitinophagaceae bacterium]
MKRFLPIVSIILLIAIHSEGQSRNVPPDGSERIVKFFPNPATSFITFDLQKNSDKSYDMQVYNFLGKVVYEQKSIPSRTTINLTDYNRGVYIYQLRERDGRVIESGKFQVSK